jgi:hypothetical protein
MGRRMKKKKPKQINGPIPFVDAKKAHERTMKIFSDQLKKSKKRGRDGKN